MFRAINLYLMILWLIVGGVLYFGEHLLPETFARIEPGRRSTFNLVAYVAFALAGWNLIRWLMLRSRPRSTPPSPLARRDREGDKPVLNPEFRFDQPTSERPRRPSSNGDTP